MSLLVMKERPVRDLMHSEAYERFHRSLEAADAGEPTGFEPADYDDDRLLRVLIVDDHQATADTLSSQVAIWGHEIQRAYDGVTGLALAAAHRPDVLLLDILMPDMSGFEVAWQVRQQDRLRHCFIVAVTGRTDAK